MKRTPLARRTPLRARPRRRKSGEQLASEAWARTVGSGPCAVTGLWGSGDDRIVRHHAITRQRLRRHARDHGLSETALEWDPRVGMAVLESVHVAHHSRRRPIPFEALPESVHVFAAEYGLEDYLRRVYPRHCEFCGAQVVNQWAHAEACPGQREEQR